MVPPTIQAPLLLPDEVYTNQPPTNAIMSIWLTIRKKVRVCPLDRAMKKMGMYTARKTATQPAIGQP